MPKLIDLTGQRFGKLTVIEKGPSKNRHAYWYCSCDCGHNNHFLVQGTHLKNGKVTHCPQCYGNNIKKNCVVCGKEFTSNFPTRKYCYQCSPTYSSKTGRASSITALRRAIKKELVRYKGGQCVICGYSKSLNALQFHHLDSSQKDFNLSDAYNGGNVDMDKLYQEVDKCILICANCHAELHEKDCVEKE